MNRYSLALLMQRNAEASAHRERHEVAWQAQAARSAVMAGTSGSSEHHIGYASWVYSNVRTHVDSITQSGRICGLVDLSAFDKRARATCRWDLVSSPETTDQSATCTHHEWRRSDTRRGSDHDHNDISSIMDIVPDRGVDGKTLQYVYSKYKGVDCNVFKRKLFSACE